MAADGLSAHRVKPLRSPYGLQAPPPFVPSNQTRVAGHAAKGHSTIMVFKQRAGVTRAPGQVSRVVTRRKTQSSGVEV